MSNTFHIGSNPHGTARESNRSAARRAKLDVITAAMLTGGASGGWGMARAFKSRAARGEGCSRAHAQRESAKDNNGQSQAA